IEKFAKLIGNKDIEQILPNDIEKYISSRINRVKNRTINRELDVIKRIFSLAVQNKKLKVSPCSTIKDLRIENPPERFLTKAEEEKLLSVCNPTMQAIIITALHTGMRQNEILSLKWEDVFFAEKYLIARNTKNNKVRKLPLTDKLAEVLHNLPRFSEYVFTSPVTLSRYKEVKSTFARAVKRAGIPHISFHKLRHSTASRLNESGVDIVTIQKILDHSDIRTTMLYTHNASKSIEDAFRKLNDY
ncbi:site-specific integrase, partial [bacterium]|nr:site-specific integrase [bacterium]